MTTKKTDVQLAQERYQTLKELFESGDWVHDFEYTSWGSFQHELRRYFLNLLEALGTAKENLDSLVSLEKTEIANSEEELTDEQKTRWSLVNRKTVKYDIDRILTDYSGIDPRAIPPFLKVTVNTKQFDDWAAMAQVNSEDYVSDTKVSRSLRSKMK
tara:strand:+ start:2259 stop:2729 length:471 start_codon:yes stop_codon:yes gene_type:complete